MVRIGCTCKRFREINVVAGSAPEALLVGLGAIPGAWLRLKVVNHFQPMVPKKHWGTFMVNVVACFALGLVLALNETCAPSTGIALLMVVGFFGSLSTFSTFAVELLNELRAGQALTARNSFSNSTAKVEKVLRLPKKPTPISRAMPVLAEQVSLSAKTSPRAKQATTFTRKVPQCFFGTIG